MGCLPINGSDSAGTAVGAAGIQRRLVLLLAVTAGVAVARNYYAQPLCNYSPSLERRQAYHKPSGDRQPDRLRAGVGSHCASGDPLERRRLITGLLSVSAIGLLAAALSPTLAVLAIASLIVGVTSVVAQIAVPFSASLAAEHERGLVVGTVMSGLLIGMLSARTFAGFVADFLHLSIFCGSNIFAQKNRQVAREFITDDCRLTTSDAAFSYFAKLGFLFSMNALTPSLQSGAQEISPAPK